MKKGNTFIFRFLSSDENVVDILSVQMDWYFGEQSR